MSYQKDKNKAVEYLSVLFTDIVGYSKLINADQISCKAKFNEIWAESLSELGNPPVVCIDTGDGAILASLEDPEIPIKFALLMMKKYNEQNVVLKFGMSVRMGINFGPVEVAKDINGNSTVLGDGINNGQRIMSFANPNELLISRPYFDLIKPLSYEYKDMFGYFGKRSDKHNHSHELYRFLSESLVAKGEVPYSQESKVLEIKKDRLIISRIFHFILRWSKELIKVTLFLLIAYEIYILFPVIKSPELVKQKITSQYNSAKAYIFLPVVPVHNGK